MHNAKSKVIRLAQYEELQSVSQLMQTIFRLKMQGQYTKEGKENFEKLIALSALEKRYLEDNLFYIYIQDEDIKGMIEIESPCHIAFLFSSIEKQGIAKALCETALERNNEDICTVGAFSDAIDFYKKIGFVKVGDENTINGMNFTLMAKANPLHKNIQK